MNALDQTKTEQQNVVAELKRIRHFRRQYPGSPIWRQKEDDAKAKFRDVEFRLRAELQNQFVREAMS